LTEVCRFSCRYHGWQYDDQGELIKAPKFETSPGFKADENGLFEIKLILTRDGLIFVNFDETTMNLPFGNVESGLDMKAYRWLDGSSVKTGVNWKVIGWSDHICQATTADNLQVTTSSDRLIGLEYRLAGSIPRRPNQSGFLVH
jgi:phenylpropionate dioxygenase-like ring-hydroxylating dioxygenase large terminal subunit